MLFEKADHTIDVRGHICPYPIIIVKKALKNLKAGEVLEVRTDFEIAVSVTIPAFCNKKGYTYEIRQIEKKVWLILIQKKGED